MAGGWRTSPIVRVRSKSTCSPFRTSTAAANGKSRPRGEANRSGRRTTKELFYVGANGTLMGVSVEASRRDLEQRHADEAARGALPDRRRREWWPHVRCVARRPALPDDQRARDRRGRRAARAHRRAALGRGVEAPRADEIGWRSSAAHAWARTKFFPRSAPVGWARSIAPVIRRSIATSQSKSCLSFLPTIPIAWRARRLAIRSAACGNIVLVADAPIVQGDPS